MQSDHKVTFVLPGDFRSGGVRVTVIMANLLLDRGHDVRIVHPRPANAANGLSRLYRTLCFSPVHTGWLHEFRGPVQRYRTLDELSYSPAEVVIAVGTYMVRSVRQLTSPVIKLRFNHGFTAAPTGEQLDAWRGEMNTITVSQRLVPRLEELSGQAVLGVVPNGIDRRDYFVDASIPRAGVGAIYNPHPNKAPHDLVAVLRRAHQKWPHIPQHVFSTEPCPSQLSHVRFRRYPSVAKARDYYNRARVWLLTSYTEGLPGAVLEAMACGCVVVTSDNDGSLEVVRDGHNGLVVPRGDIDGYLGAIDRVFDNPALAQKLARGAAATVSEFTWARAADKMEDVLQRVREASPALSLS